MQAREKIDVSKYETAQQLYHVDLMLIDSLVQLSPRDTVTRVRYVRATTKAVESREAATTETQTDSVASVETQIELKPIAAESIKNGSAWLRPRFNLLEMLIFTLFFMILVECVKKSLFLRHK